MEVSCEGDICRAIISESLVKYLTAYKPCVISLDACGEINLRCKCNMSQNRFVNNEIFNQFSGCEPAIATGMMFKGSTGAKAV